jgi:uncharacterized membrane protein YidH (DUF202 family)
MTGQLAGLALVVLGVLAAIFGDKKIDTNAGKISKTFTMPPLSAKILKWALALILVWFGVSLLFGGGQL